MTPVNQRPFRVGLVQTACSPDPVANLDKAAQKIREAASAGAQIICLQELFRSQYFCREEKADLFDLAEPLPGPSTDVMTKLAKELNVVIVASLFEKRAEGLYHNTAAIIDASGDLLGLYRKMHIPDDPLFFEKFYFTPGDLGFRAWDTRYGRIGVLVCWDQWYPEGARLTAMQGANILFYPTAIGWHPAEKDEFGAAQLDAWQTIQRSHAIANGIYVAAVNRVGFEKGPTDSGLEFWGNSFLADPFGRVLARAGSDTEEILVHECDPRLMDEVRRNWPFFRDRRIDHYGDITKRWLEQVTRWRMPAEWEPHEGTWLGWPHEKSDWPGKFAPIPFVYGKIIARLSRHERVHILCQTEAEVELATRLAKREGADAANLDFHLCPTDRSWVRDTAPIFTVDGSGGLCATDWHFNGWAKYPNWQCDDKVPAFVARKLKCARVVPKAGGKRFVLEGGSIDVNGQGLLLTTEECLLSPIQARNPHLGREQIEAVLSEHLGLDRVIWLLNGIEGDDTHGHVDDLARFTAPNAVVIATENARKDPNVKVLQSVGNLEIVTLPMPGKVYYDGQLLPASYANFYIANHQVLVPTFNDAKDRLALITLTRLFPNHEVAGIDCTDLVLGLGTLHCVTQQQPAV